MTEFRRWIRRHLKINSLARTISFKESCVQIQGDDSEPYGQKNPSGRLFRDPNESGFVAAQAETWTRLHELKPANARFLNRRVRDGSARRILLCRRAAGPWFDSLEHCLIRTAEGRICCWLPSQNAHDHRAKGDRNKRHALRRLSPRDGRSLLGVKRRLKFEGRGGKLDLFHWLRVRVRLRERGPSGCQERHTAARTRFDRPSLTWRCFHIDPELRVLCCHVLPIGSLAPEPFFHVF